MSEQTVDDGVGSIEGRLNRMLGAAIARIGEQEDRIAALENALRRCIPLLPSEWQSEVARVLTEER